MIKSLAARSPLPRLATLAAFTLMLCGQVAQAVPVAVATASADWTNLNSARGQNLEFIDNDGITGNEELRWGGPTVSTAQKSGYLYTANNASYELDRMLEITLGYFTHINQTILAGTSIRDVQLRTEFMFSVAGFAPVALPLDFLFRHRETTNDCDSSPDCANDLVTVTLTEMAPVRFGNNIYQIDAIGFLLGNSVMSEFSTVEEQDNLAPIVARLTRTAVPVPAPGTLLLAATGAALLMARRRKPAQPARSR